MRTTEKIVFTNNGNNVNLTEYIGMSGTTLNKMITDREADLTKMKTEMAILQFEIKKLGEARKKQIGPTIKTEGGRKTRHRRSRSRRHR
jgi:DNA-binding Xre family transcriptional regulator